MFGKTSGNTQNKLDTSSSAQTAQLSSNYIESDNVEGSGLKNQFRRKTIPNTFSIREPTLRVHDDKKVDDPSNIKKLRKC